MTVRTTARGFRYLAGMPQYSAGVIADPGFALRRIRLERPLPLRDGFAAAADLLSSSGLRVTALCAFELRSPQQVTDVGFAAFNVRYLELMGEYGLLELDGANPVARSNVVPFAVPVAEPSVHAFTYAAPHNGEESTFVVAGSAEVPEGHDDYTSHIVAPADTSASGLAAKIDWVRGEMRRRVADLGADWSRATQWQIYTRHKVGVIDVVDPVAQPYAEAAFHACTPPILGLEFEADLRRVASDSFV
ncbi:2-amino-5-chloromuconate deaminase CnbZ [Microbacterium lacticum]